MRRRVLLAAMLLPGARPAAAKRPARALRGAAEVRAFLAAGFPLGTPAEEAARRLTAEGIEHSPLLQADRTVRAIWRDVGGSLPARRSVLAVLRFDAQGHLTAIEVTDAFTGL